MVYNPVSCSAAVEDVFGPSVSPSCLGGFDFTLLFEETLLGIVPLGIALILTLTRAFTLRNASPKVKPSWLLTAKMASYSIYIVLQAALIGLWAQPHTAKTRATLAAISTTLGGFILLMHVSYLEHTRSVRPSTTLTIYLGLSTLLDLARVRTLFYFEAGDTIAALFLSGFCVKLVIFILELYEKRRFLHPSWQHVSPEATGSTYNRALFVWLNRLFVRGFRTPLTVETLMPLDDELLAASEATLLKEKWAQADKSGKYALLWTFIRHYKWTLLAATPPRLAFTGFTFAQPFLVQRVLTYTADTTESNTRNVAYGLIGAYAIVYIGIAVSYAVYEHKSYRALTICRGSLISFIYDQTLQISTSAVSDAEALTLMSADIDRIGMSMHDIHELYAGLVELGLSLWLLYVYLGQAMAASTAFVIVALVASARFATVAGNAQEPWLDAIETRLAATSKVMGVMKAIRMSGISRTVSSTIAYFRSAEIKTSRRYRILNIFVNSGFYVSSTFAPVWGFGAFILLARSRDTHTLTEDIVFPVLSLFQLQDQPTVNIVDALEHIQTICVCFERIQEYLLTETRGSPLADSLDDDSSKSNSIKGNDAPIEKPEKVPPVDLARLDNSLGSMAAFSARDATVAFSSSKGPVLNQVTFDIVQSKITMIVGPVGSGKSTLLNLLLGEVPQPDGFIYRGFSRSAFCPQSPWIFRGTIRENIVGLTPWDELWYKTVVQACALSIDFQEFPEADQTQVGTHGSRLSGGQQLRVAFARALYSREKVLILDNVLAGIDRITEQTILDAVFGPGGLIRKLGSTVVLATSTARQLRYADHVIVLDKDGKVAQQSTPDELSSIKDDLEGFSKGPSNAAFQSQFEVPEDFLQQLNVPEEEYETDPSRQVGDLKVYAYYLGIAGWGTMLAYLFLYSLFIFGLNFPSLWLQWWANANVLHPNGRIGYWLGAYGAIAATAFLGSIASDCVFQLIVVPRTMRKFHERLLSTTMEATTAFITSTDSGTILNRFSQDLQLIDSDLPGALDKTIFAILSATFSAVLVFIGSGYVAAAIPLCMAVLYTIQLYYLRTSRQLRLLDIEAKAPLFSVFLETLEGLPSIRAYGWTGDYAQRSREVLDASQKPYYLLWCIQRWLTLVLNLVVAGISVLLVALATNISGGSTGFLGVALFNIVSFSSTLQLVVTEWTQLETAIGAVSRIRSFVANTESEHLDDETGDVPAGWPKSGSITFTNVSASYQSSSKPVLSGISLDIKQGEKIAICGRTGSGKSSLISTLLRMLDLDDGKIAIDGIDITKMPRGELRERLNTVPQEPFLLQDTVRNNLDPLQLATDERLIEVLRTLNLWDIFETDGGLESDLEDDMLSHGQRQIFCLGRAMVRSGNVLILDEVSSSVDTDTDEFIQRIIHDEFRHHTIVAIAHKLNTVLDFDRIVFLDKGSIVEVGSPQELLATPTSLFRAQYESMSNDS